jgi:hypothetical protein
LLKLKFIVNPNGTQIRRQKIEKKKKETAGVKSLKLFLRKTFPVAISSDDTTARATPIPYSSINNLFQLP